MDQERFRDLAIEYVLGTLEGAELASFEAELTRRGPSGREELDRLAETLGDVALSSPTREPPAGLRARVMAEVSSSSASPGPSATAPGVAHRGGPGCPAKSP